GAQNVEQPQENVLRVASPEPPGGQGADAVHAADHRDCHGAEHRALAADREISRQVCRQEDEVEAAYEIRTRHHDDGAMTSRVADCLAHRYARVALLWNVVGGAGPVTG